MGSGSLRQSIKTSAIKTAKWAVSEPSRKPRKPRKRLDPKERSQSHAYLRFAAEKARIPYDGARHSMQMLAQMYGVELPEPTGRAKRSGPVIDLAKLIKAKSGLVMTEDDEKRMAFIVKGSAPIVGW